MAGTSTRAPAADAGAPALPPRRSPNPWFRRGLVFLICALAINALIGERGLSETLRVRSDVQQVTAEILRLRQENARLADYAHRLDTDARTIEMIARREFGLMRKGEILVIVKDLPSR